MSAPLPTSGAHPELQAWQELEEVFARLSHLARTSVAPPEFYRTVLEQSVLALSADGGAVWLRGWKGARRGRTIGPSSAAQPGCVGRNRRHRWPAGNQREIGSAQSHRTCFGS